MANDSLPTRQCLQCEQEKRLHARGLCGTCYRKTWAQENPERNRAIAVRKYEKNREKDKEWHRRYYAENRERLIAQQRVCDLRRFEEKSEYNRQYQLQYRDPQYHRVYKLKKLYGLSLVEYDGMVADQGGVCAICGLENTVRTRNGMTHLRVDHDHFTGRVRGLLCSPCNTQLGIIEQHKWQGWISKANAYLEKHESIHGKKAS